MRCSDCVVFISRRLDGSLSETENADLEEHLAGCTRCRAELALQKNLIHTLKREIPGTLPEDFTMHVTGHVAALATAKRRPRFRPADLLPALLPAAVGVLLIVFHREIAGITAPAMEAVETTVGEPLAGLGKPVADLMTRVPALSLRNISHSETLARLIANSYFGLAVAGAAVAWAFSRAYSFVRL